MDRECIEQCCLESENRKGDLADIERLRLFFEDTEGIGSLFFLPRDNRPKYDLVPRRDDDFFRSVFRIDDELEWDRVVHHDEFKCLLTTDHPVIPDLILSDPLHDIPVVRLDDLLSGREQSISDIVEPITDTDDRPEPLQCIDRLVDPSALTYDAS